MRRVSAKQRIQCFSYPLGRCILFLPQRVLVLSHFLFLASTNQRRFFYGRVSFGPLQQAVLTYSHHFSNDRNFLFSFYRAALLFEWYTPPLPRFK